MSTAIPPIKKRSFLNALELKLRRSRGDMLQVFLSAVMAKCMGTISFLRQLIIPKAI